VAGKARSQNVKLHYLRRSLTRGRRLEMMAKHADFCCTGWPKGIYFHLDPRVWRLHWLERKHQRTLTATKRLAKERETDLSEYSQSDLEQSKARLISFTETLGFRSSREVNFYPGRVDASTIWRPPL